MTIQKWIACLLTAALVLCTCAACGTADPAGTSSGGTDADADASQTSASAQTTTTTTQAPVQQIGVAEMRKLISNRAGSLILNDEILARGIVNAGNRARIAAAIRKAVNGEDIVLGTIGGSITEGTAASLPDNNWANQFRIWWEKLFPKCHVRLVNIGKGATGSMIGVHCAGDQLLPEKPDVVIMEYAVNDGDAPLHHETYESLIRRLWQAESKPAVMLLFTMNSDGSNVQKPQSKIGEHYDLPMISYRDAIFPQIEKGIFDWSYIAADGVHPNDTGHAMIGLLIANYLVNVYEELDSIPTAEPAFPAPIVGESFINGKLYTRDNLKAASLGSFREVSDAFYQFPNGWRVTGGGTEPIVFTIPDCKQLYMMTNRLDDSNAGIVSVTVRGETEQTKDVQQNYPNLGYQYADPIEVYSGVSPTTVTVTVQLKPTSPSDYFNILGFLAS